MKKIFIALLAVAVCLASCKKDETVKPTGTITINGTQAATAVTLPDNLLAKESVAATMPESAILNSFKLTKEEFMTAWAEGKIKFGACEKNSEAQVKWESTLGQGRWGQCFGIDGAIYHDGEEGGLICIEGTTSPFNYKIYDVDDIYDYIGKTINCKQAFQYTSDKGTTTIYVPWAITIKKGDTKVIAGGREGHTMTYDKGDGTYVMAVSAGAVKTSIGVGIDTAKAFAYVDKAIVGKAADTLYFAADGTVAGEDDAAVIVFKNAKKEWCYKLTKNESSEGETVKPSIAFLNSESNYAYTFAINLIVKERKFAKFTGTFSMTKGVVFQGEVLRTDNEREFTFDFPKAAYDTLASMAAKKGQAGVTMALLIEKGFMLVQGPMATKEESTASPYGHWFDNSANVCKQTSSQVYAGLIIETDSTTGHCPITYCNVPGKDKVGDVKTFQQTLYSTALGMTIPVTYVVKIVKAVAEEE